MDNEYDSIRVADARRSLLRVLRIGGSAGLRVGDEYRVMQHFPSFDRPRLRLPWPLSRFQPFSFTIRWSKATLIETVLGIPIPPNAVRSSDEEIEEMTFDRNSLNEGLAFFLRDADPDDEISVTYLPHL